VAEPYILNVKKWRV